MLKMLDFNLFKKENSKILSNICSQAFTILLIQNVTKILKVVMLMTYVIVVRQ